MSKINKNKHSSQSVAIQKRMGPRVAIFMAWEKQIQHGNVPLLLQREGDQSVAQDPPILP